jgi:elongation factor 1-gamma
VDDWNVDAPSYKFEKLDPTADSTKELVKEYFSWEGKFANLGGKPFAQGKIFK